MRVVNHVNHSEIKLFVTCQFVSGVTLVIALLGSIARVIVRRLFRWQIT